MSKNARRIQFVISGPFLLLLLLAAGLETAGFWLYTHQPPPQPPQTPPYYVNRTVTAVRPCFQCQGADGKLKPPESWKFGKTVEIPEGQQWWFSPVEEHELPVKVDGIPMLALHPAAQNDKPWEGFDQRRVLLVVFQDLDARFSIEHPAPPPAPASTPAAGATDTPPPASDGSQPITTQPQQP
ncbi:MAG TPA: hypothetical protein VN841_01580 [Bryobacteraceae bacterium]|nr:hypothetical protein [Bryobacteraceae bacterium]